MDTQTVERLRAFARLYPEHPAPQASGTHGPGNDYVAWIVRRGSSHILFEGAPGTIEETIYDLECQINPEVGMQRRLQKLAMCQKVVDEERAP